MDTGVRALPILSLITFFIWLDSRLAGGLRASQIRRDKRRSHGGRCHHVRELGPLITAIRCHRAFRFCIRCRTWNHEGE